MRKLTTAGAGATMALTASFALGGPAQAQSYFDFAAPQPGQLPAVSAPNWKVQIAGGAHDGRREDGGTVDMRASYSAPLTFSTGYQIDALLAPIGGETWGAVGGHYFWRDPSRYLSGVYADVNWYDSVTWGSLAYEGEYYFQRTTVSFLLGGSFGELSTELLTEGRLSYYLTDDLVVSGGIRHDDGTYGLARLEYQINPAYSGMTLFADGRWSDHHDRILAGVKFHFGTGPKSLIRRHREDDPFYKVGNRVIFLPFRVPFLEEVGGGDEGMKID